MDIVQTALVPPVIVIIVPGHIIVETTYSIRRLIVSVTGAAAAGGPKGDWIWVFRVQWATANCDQPARGERFCLHIEHYSVELVVARPTMNDQQ